MAGDTELVNLVDEFLYLVEVGSGSTVADESELEHLLDRLALAVRTQIVPGEPEDPPEIPARNFDVLRKVVGSRFPNYGSYSRPAPPGANGLPGPAELASAIDDVATIADHLHAVAWLWRSASFDLGLGYLDVSHRAHWGRPMRALQLYLHDKRAAAEEFAS